MKLVKIGNFIFNMDNLLIIEDQGTQMKIHFTCSTAERSISVMLEGENYVQMCLWLKRNGVNDISTETPKLNWYLDS